MLVIDYFETRRMNPFYWTLCLIYFIRDRQTGRRGVSDIKVLFYTSLGTAILLFAGTLIFAGAECCSQILIAIGSIVVVAIIICLSDLYKERKKSSTLVASGHRRRR